ncbi:MAG: hypothetical protein J6C76_07045, partial [Oscillospiraceae bacterium]|nr:hypothetical protein [Oscillospiraceae bacterium]
MKISKKIIVILGILLVLAFSFVFYDIILDSDVLGVSFVTTQKTPEPTPTPTPEPTIKPAETTTFI